MGTELCPVILSIGHNINQKTHKLKQYFLEHQIMY
jgi:hypothetical protein